MNYSETVTEDLGFAPYIREITVVAERGHKDLSTENLLLALVEIHRTQPATMEEFITVFLQHAVKDELEITPRAFRLSLLTAIKLYLRNIGTKDYEFFSMHSWKQVVLTCLKELDEEFIRYCLRDVSTVKIYRYIALQLLGGMLNHSRLTSSEGVNILDGGCSINIGLKCLNDLEIFQPVELASEILLLFKCEIPHFPLQYALGIDKYPPSIERTLASLFPSEVKRWEELYTKLSYLNKKRVQYQQQDILYLKQLKEFQEKFDIIFLSSLLRRFPPHQIADVLLQTNYSTSPQGFLVINEQMSEETIEGGGNYATYILPKHLLERLVHQKNKTVGLYELLNIAFQLFVYPDENCQQVFPGKDFRIFLKRYTSFTPK
ncbi:MAG: hypothetical protein GY801_01420 [bacterium]|nr:hypothetical protein [bacterium]